MDLTREESLPKYLCDKSQKLIYSEIFSSYITILAYFTLTHLCSHLLALEDYRCELNYTITIKSFYQLTLERFDPKLA